MVESIPCVKIKSEALCNGKGKGKILPRTGHEDPEGNKMYSSTLPSISALEGWVVNVTLHPF